MGTARDLTITSWAKEKGESPFTVAVPGIKITGWWPDSPPPIEVLEGLRRIWPSSGVMFKLELDILEDLDGKKHQVCAYIRIHQYPEPWLEVIRSSLEFFVNRGAAISWAGGWECFLQYSSAERFAGCYAAFTTTTDLVGGGELKDPVRYLDQIGGAATRLHKGVAADVSGLR